MVYIHEYVLSRMFEVIGVFLKRFYPLRIPDEDPSKTMEKQKSLVSTIHNLINLAADKIEE